MRDHDRRRRNDLRRADSGDKAEAARTMINAIANPTMPKGERYLGTVVKITAFGAFVSLLPRQGRPAAHLQLLAGGRAWRTLRTWSASARRSRWRSTRWTIEASCHSSLWSRNRRPSESCPQRRTPTGLRDRSTAPLVRARASMREDLPSQSPAAAFGRPVVSRQ